MKIVILGAGQVGGSVAHILASEANDVTVVDASAERLQALQDRLAAYGGMEPFGRDRMVSARFLTEELAQLGNMAATLPPRASTAVCFMASLAKTAISVVPPPRSTRATPISRSSSVSTALAEASDSRAISETSS